MIIGTRNAHHCMVDVFWMCLSWGGGVLQRVVGSALVFFLCVHVMVAAMGDCFIMYWGKKQLQIWPKCKMARTLFADAKIDDDISKSFGHTPAIWWVYPKSSLYSSQYLTSTDVMVGTLPYFLATVESIGARHQQTMLVTITWDAHIGC